MKTPVFLILGYGIPKQPKTDLNLSLYLRSAFNTIWQSARGQTATIIFSGGATDMQAPYRRREATVLHEQFAALTKRASVKKETQNWICREEPKALSSLDNLVFTAELLKRKKVPVESLTIFCEYTRRVRILRVAKKIFRSTKIVVIPLDFDQSENRYLDPAFLEKKESIALNIDLRALKNPKDYATHQSLHRERIKKFREGKHHVKDIQKWWKESWELFDKGK